MNEFNHYLVNLEETYLDALKKIDINKKGFTIVIDSELHVKGTLTDGDIRRKSISGVDLNSKVGNAYTSDFISVMETENFTKVITLFKDKAINFLPIISKDGKFKNVITKKNLHALLLQGITPDFSYDFVRIDDSIVDYEIFEKPWGFYKTVVLNESYQTKVININPNSSISLQEHTRREEHWVIVNGIGNVIVGGSEISVKAGSYIFIPKKCKHRLTNKSKKTNLICIEVQLGNDFSEDDIIRYKDDYGRAK